MTSVFLGIDTSNYTTSAALVSGAGEVFSSKRILKVRDGERGVRQSEALFCHTRDLSAIVRDVFIAQRSALHGAVIRGVGVSTRPRDVEGSYMPCFLAGLSAASVAARALDVPLVETSHQEGHLAAAAYGAAESGRPLPPGPFLALHLSGGTGELLYARARKSGYAVERLASFPDITPGQLIDRSGVKLGLSFPAGRELEKLAEQGCFTGRIRPAVKPGEVCLSGFENQFDKLRADGASREDAAAFIFAAVEESVRALLSLAGERGTGLPVLFSGGVSSSYLLRERLAAENHYFTAPAYAADNAVGVALIARNTLTGEA